MSATNNSWEQEIKDRQEFRCQLVANFTFTVMDHGVALTKCPGCSSLLAVNSAFPDADWNSIYHLLSVLETFIESRQCQLTCTNCKQEITLSNQNEDVEYWIWHAHFLSEVKLDLQLLLNRKNGKTAWIEGMLIDSTNQITPIALPCSETEFRDRTGCYFSLRQTWKELLQQHWPVKEFAGLKVSDGYYLIVNPPVDKNKQLQLFKDSCINLLGSSNPASTQFEFADLSWADSWNFEENTYHQWLSDYENDIEESKIITGVLASPQQFFNVVQHELKPFGCWLRLENNGSSVAILGDDEYYQSFDFREYLINAMIKGYNYWGALRYIEPIIDNWERVRNLGQRLRNLLKSYKCTISGGHFFQCRRLRGKNLCAEFDLVTLEDPEEVPEDEKEFIEWIAPQIDLNPRSLKFEKS